MEIGEVYPTNSCGDVEIISYEGVNKVVVRFFNTGATKLTSARCIKAKTVKDKYAPSLYGVGYLGEGLHKANVKGKATPAYYTWAGMLARCYNPKNHNYCLYGAKGVSVCTEWHCFQTFANWYESNFIERCQLDKDVIGDGSIYSPNSCQFVPPQVNAEQASAKHYRVKDPLGNVHEVYNLNKFIREHGLGKSLHNVCAGRAQSHRGWTKA